MHIETFRLLPASVKRNGRLVCRLRCDNCLKEFIHQKPCVVTNRVVHYCSRTCKDTSDINRIRVKEANVKAYANRRDEILAKIRATVEANHGIDCMLRLDRVIRAAHTPSVETVRRASLKRANACGSPAKKRHSTMKQNESYGSSKSEDACYQLLCETYGSNQVRRQVELESWSIDFYVNCIDTYVQFDGAYWHGLDRAAEVIKRSSMLGHKRDKSILFTLETDRKQCEWALVNNVRLVRITDKEFRCNPMLLIERLSC